MLQEIRSEIPLLGGVAKMTCQETEHYGRAKKEFLECLAAVNSKTTNPAARIYRLTDELTKKYYLQNETKDIACLKCRGGQCCLQLVFCTKLEMSVIQDYLAGLPRKTRRKICQHVRKHALKYFHLHQTTFGTTFDNGSPFEQILRTKQLMTRYYGKPCPYLNDAKRCAIYPVRPLDCRIAKTRDKFCGTNLEFNAQIRKIQPVWLMFEYVATNLMQDEEMRIYGELTIVPLSEWPLIEPFNKIFFPQHK